MIDLKGKSVLITGGSRGIGAACVKLFVKAGAEVAFTYNSNKKAAGKLISSFGNGKKILAYKMDLQSEKDVNSKIKKMKKDFGKIDILVNNAGIWKRGEADSMSLNDWEEMIRINLTGTFLISRAVIPLMKENNFGRIINISSTAGQRGEAFYSHYASSKGAIISYTKSLAAELGKFGITTNCVAPGWVYTDMTSGVFEDENYKKQVEENIPVNRIASAEDIAGPVLFLASGLARHINGEVVNVNGGSVLCG